MTRMVPPERLSPDRVSQQQLKPARHMEAYRKLSGAVTHDINNLLSGILGYSELLLLETSDTTLQSSVDEIRIAGKRIASLTQLLSAFTDKYIYRPELLDLNEEIHALQRYMPDILGKTIEFSTSPSSGTWPVRADRAKLKQALITLAIEIRNLLPQGGRLHIAAQNLPHALLPPMVSPHVPSNYVVVTALISGRIAVDRVPDSLIAPATSADNNTEIDPGAIPSVSYLIGLANGYSVLNGYSRQELSLSLYLPAAGSDL